MSEPRDESVSDPATTTPHALNYRTPTLADYDVARLVPVARMRITEADLAKIKLESEGIPCLLRDSASAVANSFIVTDVPVLVRAEDLVRAKEVLARPADDSMEGEYVEEDYRCPKCHRRDVELLPLSGFRRTLRTVWIALIVVPIAWSIFTTVTGISPGRAFDQTLVSLTLLWVLVVIVMGAVVLIGKREKRCRTCGARWTRAGISEQQ